MAKARMNVAVGTQIDLTGFRDGIKNINKTVQETPLSFKVQTAGNLADQVGDAKKFFEAIESGSENIEKLSVRYTKFKEIASGREFRIPVSALKEVRSATGDVIVSTEEWNKELIKSTKANKDFALVGKEVASVNMGATARKTASDFNAMAKSLDGNVKSADTFLEKSKNMSGKQVEAARKVALALKAEKEEFDKLFGAPGKKNWDAIAKKGEQIRQLSTEFEKLKGATAAGANVFQSWGERISNAVKQTISYGLSIQLVRKAQELLNESVQYAIDLNKEMVKIQVLQATGAQSPEEIEALAISFNELGQAMGASTLEIARGSVEWLRQGRTVEETQELLKSSLYLAKLGAMDSADATNYLTSITNAFKISSEDAVSVVDKLIAVDNIAATSAGELATAMRYTSESAAIAGVSMEQLVSYIGTVSTVTRQNAEMIGQAFKTMFARMTQIQGGGFDDTGMSISKVEAAMKAVNIQIKNADGTWRGMGDVLEEVAGKWDTLTTRQQVEIATAVAGVRQKEAFLVLMDNMDKALTYQAAQTDATGLAMDRYGIYLESVEAKQGKFNAKMEHMKSTIVSPELVKGFYDTASAILDLIDSAGGLIPVLTIVLGLFVAIKGASIVSAIQSTITALGGLITSFLTVGTAATAAATGTALFSAALSPIGAIIAVIGLAITGYNLYMADHKKKYEDAAVAVQEYLSNVEKIPDVSRNAENALNNINELLKKQRTEGLQPNELEELRSLYMQLYKMAPNLQWTFPRGNPVLEVIPTIEELNQKILENTYLNAEAIKDFTTNMEGQKKQYKDNADAIISNKYALDLLTKAQNMSKQEFYEYYSDLQDMSLIEKWTTESYDAEGYKIAMNMLDPIYNNLINIAPDRLADVMESAMIQVGSTISTSERGNDLVTQGWVQMFASALVSTDPVIKNWIEVEIPALIASDPIMGPAVAKALSQAILQNLPQVELPPLTTVIQPTVETTEAARVAAIEAANEAYDRQIELIKNVANIIGKIKTIDISTAKGQAQLTDEVKSFANEINGLDIEGLTMDIGEFWDENEKAWNTRKLKLWAESIAINETLMAQIVSQYPELASVIEDFKNDSINALRETEDAMVSLGGTIAGVSQLTKAEFSSLVSATAADIWSLVEQENIALYTSQNQVITTEEQLRVALQNGLITYDALITQLAAHGSKYLSDFNKYIKDSVNYARNPFTTLPPGEPAWGGGGGGGGSAPPNPRIKQIEDEIEALNKQKEALQDRLKEFKKYIDAQKESLQRAKEEDDYLEESARKHKDLGNLKARIALLALDDSEEAQAKRLELEEEAAELETEIAEDNEDRIYDLKIQALEDIQKAFEESIQDQIDAIEDLIDALNEEKESLQDVATGSGGSYSGVGAAAEQYGATAEEIFAMMKELFADQIEDLGITDEALMKMAEKWAAQGLSIDQATAALDRYLAKIKEIREAEDLGTPQEGKHGEGKIGRDKESPFYTPPPTPPGERPIPLHEGGIVAYHGKGLEGSLKDNEVFAKLMKGEYVATEGQMNRFMKDILPRMSLQLSNIISPTTRSSGGGTNTGDINFNMEISVAGSLDKKVLPELKKAMLKEINKTLEQRGIKRTANSFSI